MILKEKITRVGVYGIAIQEGKMLLIRQKRGPYAGRYDFPGGGIEFGESPEQALSRELAEEVAMEFDSLQLIDNLTSTIEIPASSSRGPYTFYQIGMIYRIHCCRLIKHQEGGGELEHCWINVNELAEEECSKLLWKYRTRLV